MRYSNLISMDKILKQMVLDTQEKVRAEIKERTKEIVNEVIDTHSRQLAADISVCAKAMNHDDVISIEITIQDLRK